MSDFEIIETNVNGVRMKVTRFGGGKKIFVIVPGVSLHPIYPSAAAVARQYRKMHSEYTVYLFDRKEDITKGYSIYDMADDTANAMKSLGLDGAYALGTSQGGAIVMAMMIKYPSLIKKAVIASSSARFDEASARVVLDWAELAQEHKVQQLNHTCFSQIYSDEYLEKYKEGLALFEKVGTAEECDRFAVLCRACLDFLVYDDLPKIKGEIFAVGSECDKVLTAKGTKEIAEKTGCECYIYDGYSHAVYDEAPDFIDRMLDFFNREETEK